MKTRADLFPYLEVAIIPGITLDHVDLLVTSWWRRSSPSNVLSMAIAPEDVLGVCEVFTQGLDKYPARDWETNPVRHTASQHFAAFKRHLYDGRSHDAESGLPSRYHALSRAVMLGALSMRGVLTDDRPPGLLASGSEWPEPTSYTTSTGGDAE
jgi:hypothetical protein